MTAESALDAALDYRARHWSVIPLVPRDKRPLVRWQEFQARRAEVDELRRAFRRRPEPNVGIVTGIVSGLVVLDVDPKHQGDRSLDAWEQEHGPLPRTLEAVTGGGGRHLYFAHPGGIVRNRAGLAPGIDLRGDGGYIVAPPSIHASGKRYAWRNGHGLGETPPAPLPDWLFRRVASDRRRLGHPLGHWRDLVREGVDEGERNNTIASLTGHLLWHGIDPDVAMELLLCWNRVRCRPPLPDDEVVRTVDSITRLHERDPGADPEEE